MARLKLDEAPAAEFAIKAPAAVHGARAMPLLPEAQLVGGEGLKVENVGKSFKGRAVVKSVSLRLRRGEVAGLLGPNGAGKTTCFYMVTGLIQADYGRIYLDGEDITPLPMFQRARLGVGYLPQETSIFRGMTVAQNVMAVVELNEPDRAKAKFKTDQLLDELRIAHLRDANAMSLSGGERRRCEIARALASEPAFMLLDEPFAGIDPLAITDIREVIAFFGGPRHRRAHHRPQCSRDAGHHPPRLDHPWRAKCSSRAARTRSSTTPRCAASTSATASAERQGGASD